MVKIWWERKKLRRLERQEGRGIERYSSLDPSSAWTRRVHGSFRRIALGCGAAEGFGS
jgi:hypothetical protein